MKTNNYIKSSVENGLVNRKFVDNAAFCFAVLGCIVLMSTVLISCSSVLGRLFLERSILGDFEVVEMGCAVAIFMFLPLCQLRDGNIIVDAFTMKINPFTKTLLDIVGVLMFCIMAIFFSIRMIYGVRDMFHYGEQTMLLEIPVWIPFVPAILSFFLLSLTCIFSIYIKVSDLLYRRTGTWTD